MDENTRQQVVELARRFGVLKVEHDTHHANKMRVQSEMDTIERAMYKLRWWEFVTHEELNATMAEVSA